MLTPVAQQWLLALTWFLLCLTVGLVASRWVIPRLKFLVQNTTWTGDDLLVHILAKYALPWAGLAGLYFAIHTAPLPDRYVRFGISAIFVLTVLTITMAASRFVVGIIDERFQAKGLPLASTSIIDNILRVAIFAIGILIILQSLGISVTPALTALGVGGLAVALALQDTLSNLFSGIQIIASGQMRVGDFVRLDSGQEGYVHDINWRTTTIRALTDHLIIVPNSKLAGAIVLNFHLPEPEITITVDFGVAYGSDLEKVERVVLDVVGEVMREVPGGVEDFVPRFRFQQFGESSIDGRAFLRSRGSSDQVSLRHEFIKRLHRRFAQEGIEIPFPQRDLHLRTVPGGVQRLG